MIERMNGLATTLSLLGSVHDGASARIGYYWVNIISFANCYHFLSFASLFFLSFFFVCVCTRACV